MGVPALPIRRRLRMLCSSPKPRTRYGIIELIKVFPASPLNGGKKNEVVLIDDIIDVDAIQTPKPEGRPVRESTLAQYLHPQVISVLMESILWSLIRLQGLDTFWDGELGENHRVCENYKCRFSPAWSLRKVKLTRSGRETAFGNVFFKLEDGAYMIGRSEERKIKLREMFTDLKVACIVGPAVLMARLHELLGMSVSFCEACGDVIVVQDGFGGSTEEVEVLAAAFDGGVECRGCGVRIGRSRGKGDGGKLKMFLGI